MKYPTLGEYLRFRDFLVKERNFFEEPGLGIFGKMRNCRFIRPASRKYQAPGEVCFTFRAPLEQQKKGNDYKVIVRPTKKDAGWVNIDSGWVLIVDGEREVVYSSYPFLRNTPDFLDNLKEEARVARWRVLQRPRCCGKYMQISHRKGRYKSCYWRCAVHPEDRSHDKRFEELVKPLPEDVLKRRDARHSKRQKRREDVRSRGGDPWAALKSRIAHPWEILPQQTSFQF